MCKRRVKLIEAKSSEGKVALGQTEAAIGHLGCFPANRCICMHLLWEKVKEAVYCSDLTLQQNAHAHGNGMHW